MYRYYRHVLVCMSFCDVHIYYTFYLIIVAQQPLDDLAGSTLLHILDTFALNNHNTTYTFQSNNIGMY